MPGKNKNKGCQLYFSRNIEQVSITEDMMNKLLQDQAIVNLYKSIKFLSA
jgi:hypothetical protein